MLPYHGPSQPSLAPSGRGEPPHPQPQRLLSNIPQCLAPTGQEATAARTRRTSQLALSFSLIPRVPRGQGKGAGRGIFSMWPCHLQMG